MKVWIRAKQSPRATQARDALSAALIKRTWKVLSSDDDPPENEIIDFCIAIGGDGTLLSAIRRLRGRRFDVPVLGIHGSDGLGFMHSFGVPDPSAIEAWSEVVASALVRGQYQVLERWGLSGEIFSESSQSRRTCWALNDFVFSKSQISRMVYLRLRVNEDVLLERMRGDGLIISSATGSTAYSLSAGGPVVQPGLDVLIVTPICPHEVAQRPIVLGSDVQLRVEQLQGMASSGILTCDGQELIEMSEGDSLTITRAQLPLKWVDLRCENIKSNNYFEALREKLGFGGDNDAD